MNQAEDKKIPMFKPYVSDAAIESAVETLKSGWIGQGPKVVALEKIAAQELDASFVVSVNAVSSAIRLALAIAGVDPGDEVITSAQACTQINHPILEQFAVPVFADVQYLTANIDPGDIERRITSKTKAIICTHYGGYPCDLDEIHAIAKKHNLVVIEDASDAIGATYNSKKIGALSDFTCFSLAAVQQVTAGEGGLLLAKKEEHFEAARRRRWYGIDRIRRKPNVQGYYDYDVTETGYGYHLTDIAAALALAHFTELESILNRREKIATHYRDELSKVSGVQLYESRLDRSSAHQLFSIHVEKRADFCRMMKASGIDVSIVHERNDLNSVFGGRRHDLPQLDRFEQSNISLPIYQSLSDEDYGYVAATIAKGW